jgi:predicted acylesterase/phospholipase RssA
LRALDEVLVRPGVNDFDIYVGVSAGSLVAALLAAGISPTEVYEAMMGRVSRYPNLGRRDIYGLNVKEIWRRLRGAPKVLSEGLVASLAGSAPTRDLVANLSALAPSGLFSNRPLESYVRALMHAVHAPTRFQDMKHELYITAVNVDTGYRVVFGEKGTRDVEVPRAVRASSTIPFLFTPTRIGGGDFIDGGFQQNLPIDVAVKHGAELVIAINPLVPVINTPRARGSNVLGKEGTYLKDRGGTFILDQAFRFLVSWQIRYSLQSLKTEHPEVDVILIEPRPDDLKMFSYNIMRYSARRRLMRHGYDTARATLQADPEHFHQIFERAGFTTRPVARGSTGESPAYEPTTLDNAISLLGRMPGMKRWTREQQAPTELLD